MEENQETKHVFPDPVYHGFDVITVRRLKSLLETISGSPMKKPEITAEFHNALARIATFVDTVNEQMGQNSLVIEIEEKQIKVMATNGLIHRPVCFFDLSRNGMDPKDLTDQVVAIEIYNGVKRLTQLM